MWRILHHLWSLNQDFLKEMLSLSQVSLGSTGPSLGESSVLHCRGHSGCPQCPVAAPKSLLPSQAGLSIRHIPRARVQQIPVRECERVPSGNWGTDTAGASLHISCCPAHGSGAWVGPGELKAHVERIQSRVVSCTLGIHPGEEGRGAGFLLHPLGIPCAPTPLVTSPTPDPQTPHELSRPQH